VEAVAQPSRMAAHNEEPVAAVEVRPRLARRQPERPEPRVVAQSVPGLLRETHPVDGEPRAAIGLSLVTTPSMAAPEEGEAVRDHLPVSTVARPYMAAGPERVVVGLPGPEESAGSGGLILPVAAGLLEPRTGTPVGLVLVTLSAAATAGAVVAVDRRMLTEGPADPVERLEEREVEELRVGLVPGRVV
jgi:hypothetical protein